MKGKKFFLIICLIALSFNGCKQKKQAIPLPEKPLVVIIPSFNNEAWSKRNLKSVFNQKYSNYRLIYINDCSTDATYERVTDYIISQNQPIRTTVINNQKRLGSLANLYHAIHSCANDEIIVQLDGDDWFAHEYVLQKINRLYSSRNIWLTYGSFKNWPTGTSGFCHAVSDKIISRNAFRSCNIFFAGALRTFYAWLFKKIEKKDMIDHDPSYANQFYQAAGDVAYMLPLMEMAGDRFSFVKNILYIRNVETPINDFKVHKKLQNRITKEIQKKKPYQQLQAPLSINPEWNEKKVLIQKS